MSSKLHGASLPVALISAQYTPERSCGTRPFGDALNALIPHKAPSANQVNMVSGRSRNADVSPGHEKSDAMGRLYRIVA